MIWILAFLTVVFGLGWLSAWFTTRQHVAYLALKGVPAPTVEEWKACAALAWASILRRGK